MKCSPVVEFIILLFSSLTSLIGVYNSIIEGPSPVSLIYIIVGLISNYILGILRAKNKSFPSGFKQKDYRVKRWLCQRRFSKHLLCVPPT